MIGLLSALALMLLVLPSEANFVQCPGGACAGPQGTTNDSDIINGTQNDDTIEAQGGDDIVFGGAGLDRMFGDAGDDVMFGGPHSDSMPGDDGNDIFLPGPDDLDFTQEAFGSNGNDTFHVLAGEVVGCTILYGELGSDVVNLIGFGPYSVTSPLDVPNFETGFILIIDPITGGRIFVAVSPDPQFNTEVINGTPSPNPSYFELGEWNAMFGPGQGTDPCPAYITI